VVVVGGSVVRRGGLGILAAKRAVTSNGFTGEESGATRYRRPITEDLETKQRKEGGGWKVVTIPNLRPSIILSLSIYEVDFLSV
jgi:hypothetical protein